MRPITRIDQGMADGGDLQLRKSRPSNHPARTPGSTVLAVEGHRQDSYRIKVHAIRSRRANQTRSMVALRVENENMKQWLSRDRVPYQQHGDGCLARTAYDVVGSPE